MKNVKRVRRDYTQDSLKSKYKINITRQVASDRAKKSWITKRKNGTDTVWNKGKKGCQTAWNRGLTADTDYRVSKYTKSMTRTVQKQFSSGKRKVNGFRHWKETCLEKILFEMLDSLNLSYKKNYEIRLKGFSTFPDAYVKKHKLCLYADGEYWHHYPTYLKRDKTINSLLPKYNYQILRFWGKELKKDYRSCIDRIKEKI